MAALTAFYNNFIDPHGELGAPSIHCSFGDAISLFGSPGLSWFGGLFGDASISSLSDDLGQVANLPLVGGDAFEFLQQQLNGVHPCNNNNINIISSSQQSIFSVDNLKTPEVRPEVGPKGVADVAEHRYSFEHHELNSIHYQQEPEQAFLADSPPLCFSDESRLTSQEVPAAVESSQVESECVELVSITHIPPPLNNKRLDKVEKPDESIEAAEVSVDLIQNRRPFQCGLAGCNKTFKNPQTMKMHHKTHYTDASAVAVAASLPTLTTSSVKAGQNKKIPSRCPKCRKTFVGLYELRRHYGRKHSEGEKPFGCRKCGKKFYVEVDVRDHEKLCGEPIKCKCGLKFAFKCNLVAHKKAHPTCQEHHHHHNNTFAVRKLYSNNAPATSNSTNLSATTTSDSESSTKGSSNKRAYDGAITSRYLATAAAATYADPAPELKWLPGHEAKAARYDFAALEFFTESTSPMWGSEGHNMHYPSSDYLSFANLPSPTTSFPYSSILGDLDRPLEGQSLRQSSQFQPRKHEPGFAALASILELQGPHALHGMDRLC